MPACAAAPLTESLLAPVDTARALREQLDRAEAGGGGGGGGGNGGKGTRDGDLVTATSATGWAPGPSAHVPPTGGPAGDSL
jgi:hypothetical protein